jgi:competence protein ComEA
LGIGLAKAYRIVEHRESYGPFESIDELVEVKGIGESIIASNRDRIVLK